jgi:hypothetical protein
VAKFLTLALTGALLLGLGCNAWRSQGPEDALSGVRPPATETARLLSNTRYYKLLGRPEVALKELEQAHQADPGNLKILDTLAQSYQEIGDFRRTQELYQEALAHYGANQALNNNLCFSYYLQGNLAKAEACFKEALIRDPGNAAARNNLGLVWCRQGKTAEAQRLWEQAEGAKSAQNHLNQALAFLGMSAPANYAKSPGAQVESQPQLAGSSTPAAPANLASAAKTRAAETRIPGKETPVPAPAIHPRAAVKEVAKAVQPQPEAKPQRLAAPKPVAPVVLAAAPKPEPARAQPPVKAAPLLPPAALPAKVALTEVRKPAEPRPELRPQPAKSPKPSTPVILTAAAKPPVANPAPVIHPKAAVKAAAKPAVSAAPLTAAERARAGIELRNGTRTKFLAHHTRTLLTREGFRVTLIGNYIDFGAATTTIYYRPGAEKVAQALSSEFFPGAAIEPSSRLNKKSTIKVVLGRDLVDQPRLATRAAGSKAVASPPAVEAKPLEVGTQVMPAASKAPAAPVTLSAPVQSGPDKPKIQPAAQVVSPATPENPAGGTLTAMMPNPSHLTAIELISTVIEIRNGTRSHDLAHQARSLLAGEGFNVGIIGNHIDFGATSTVIYYRTGAERVARALSSEFFPGASLTPSSRLSQGIAIKVLLGQDLLNRPRLMARLAAE